MLIRDLSILLFVVGAWSTSPETTEKPESVLIPKCPAVSDAKVEINASEYCKCTSVYPSTGRRTASIKCTFNMTENVLLDETLYPFTNVTLSSAYVRIVNASRVVISKSFLKAFMQTPSIALDIWSSGTLILNSMPEMDTSKFKSYKTFMGVGISDCFVPEVPKYFLRDRTRGGLRISKSRVGNFHQGALHNMEEMRYLVFEDSTVDFFEGSVATEGYVTLSKRNLHAWTGLELSNVTIDTISSGTFNLTHKSDMEIAKIANCKIGSLNKESAVVRGDIEVKIEGNVISRMETQAIKVEVTGNVTFNNNDISNWETDALEGIICHNRTSLKENTFHVTDPATMAFNLSTMPFHTTCSHPQLFLVIKPKHPLVIEVKTTSSWILGVVLLLMVVAVVGIAVASYQRQDWLMNFYRSQGRSHLSGLRERKLSQENLPKAVEIDPAALEVAEGIANPICIDVNERR